MHTLKLATDGHLMIPETIRHSHRWQAGMEFVIVEIGDSILLKPKKLIKQTTIEEVAGCLRYSSKPKSLEEITSIQSKDLLGF